MKIEFGPELVDSWLIISPNMEIAGMRISVIACIQLSVLTLTTIGITFHTMNEVTNQRDRGVVLYGAAMISILPPLLTGGLLSRHIEFSGISNPEEEGLIFLHSQAR